MSDLQQLPGLSDVRRRFLTVLATRRRDIAANLASLHSDPANAERSLDRIRAVMHKVSGTAGMLGLASLGEEAHRCENAIDELLSGQKEPLSEVIAGIEAFLTSADHCISAD